MLAITTIGLDIAKSVFQVHGVDARGSAVVPIGLLRFCRMITRFAPHPAGFPSSLSSSFSGRERPDAVEAQRASEEGDEAEPDEGATRLGHRSSYPHNFG
jgi:hypothetical protein